MPEWIAVICLGIIEGVTEFLPVSSTGHLLVAEHFLTKQSELFNVVIQCGTVLAVLAVFTNRLKELASHWRSQESRSYLLKLGLAFAITAVGGYLLKKNNLKLPETVAPVASATLIGGILFLVVEQWLRKRPMGNEITWKIALACGCSQLLAAAFPGTSRSGATILAALVLGANRPAATEFSFLLGIPTILAAGGYQFLKALKGPVSEPVNWGMVLLGSAVAALMAFIVVKWLLRFVQTHTFVGFAWYRIGLGILLLTFF